VTFYGGPVNSPWIGYGGGDYSINDNWTVSVYASQLKDVWNQYYAGTSVVYPLSDDLALIGGFNYYKAVDEGKKRLGEFDNNIWSAKVGVRYGALFRRVEVAVLDGVVDENRVRLTQVVKIVVAVVALVRQG